LVSIALVVLLPAIGIGIINEMVDRVSAIIG